MIFFFRLIQRDIYIFLTFSCCLKKKLLFVAADIQAFKIMVFCLLVMFQICRPLLSFKLDFFINISCYKDVYLSFAEIEIKSKGENTFLVSEIMK